MSSKELPPTIEGTRIGRLARFCYERRRLVLIAWIVGFFAITALSQMAKGKFEDKFSGGNSQSQLAQNLLTKKFPARAGDTANAVFRVADNVNSPQGMAAINQVDQQLAKMPHVASVRGPFDQGGQSQISRTDPHIAYSVIQFDKTTQDLPKKDMQSLVKAGKALNGPGIQVELGGQPIAKGQAFNFGISEIVGVWAAILILLIAFGSFVAMGLPILTALFGLGMGAGLIDLISHVVTVPTFASQLAAMIGIGVGIDYALFIVTRFRQGLHDGVDPEQAVIIALATAGRAVLFAGTTVIISLFGMMLMGLSFVYGLALAAIVTVVMVMAASLTLLPAILGFTGRAIDRWKVPHLRHKGEQRQTAAWRWSRVIQRHPWPAAISAFLVLLVLAIPLFSMRLAFSDSGNDPTSFTTRRAYDLLAQGFGPGTNGPLVIAATLPQGAADQAALDELVNTLRADPDAAFVSPASLNPAGDTAVIVALPKTSPQDAATQQFVQRVRQQVPRALAGTGITAYTGGLTAGGVDASKQLSSRLFLVIGAVVILSFLLLMAVFRSIAVPIKAAVMNLLSIGAAYGVIVAVFQWGWLGSFFGIGKTAPIDPWVPLMLFTILFGLSMDYEVFLLSRIREEWLRTGDNATSVADGLAHTARVITAAAAIMVCVFGSFVLGDLRILKLFGMGLATAVLVDATLVRMVLVPATMELLGGANWWFPHWLDRAVPTISMEVMPEPERELAGAGARE
ncbi:MAG: MMPL family transporter [Actinomycetota bacterium]|nr:MMPL family transporter [Actinomycetota bacterium]